MSSLYIRIYISLRIRTTLYYNDSKAIILVVYELSIIVFRVLEPSPPSTDDELPVHRKPHQLTTVFIKLDSNHVWILTKS